MRRRHFARRAGLVFGLFVILSVVGLATVISWATGRFAMPAGLVQVTAVVAVIVPIFIVVFAVRGMRRVAMPMLEIASAANRVAEGDLSVRVREAGPPFLRSSARAFNDMTTRLQAQEDERRRLFADVAHELRTPITVMQGRLEGMVDGIYPQGHTQLKEVLEEARVLGRLVEDLRVLATAESRALVLQREPVDVPLLIRDVAGSFKDGAERAGVSLETSASPGMSPAALDPLRIRQVLANLIDNAVRHTPAGGHVSIEAESGAGALIVRVRDTGRGIAAEDLPKVFDRFYKDEASRGSGLGLPIARSLVTAHGGELTAESRPGEGTIMTVRLPAGAHDPS